MLEGKAVMGGLMRVVPLVLFVALLGADKPVAPCTHVKADTIGWRVARFNERLSFRFPQSFKRDSTVQCMEGCRVWVDGDRRFLLTRNYSSGSFGKNDPRIEGYSECVDTLAGSAFLLITEYRRNKGESFPGFYSAIAVQGGAFAAPRETNILTAYSPRQSDTDLFLGIFRTMQMDSTTAWER